MTEDREEFASDRERLVLADRVHHHSAPRALLFEALTVDRSSWLGLQPGEVEPQVREAVPNERVVWSSFWPVSPNDTIEFDLLSEFDSHFDAASPDYERTAICFRWLTDSPPDERGIGITKQRLNRKFGGNLRAVVSEYFWSTHGRESPSPDHGRPWE